MELSFKTGWRLRIIQVSRAGMTTFDCKDHTCTFCPKDKTTSEQLYLYNFAFVKVEKAATTTTT